MPVYGLINTLNIRDSGGDILDYLPIYSLDLHTRLQIDKIAYDEREDGEETLEYKAFKLFYEKLNTLLNNSEKTLKNEKYSLDLLTLQRDINVINEVIDEYYMRLQIELDGELLAIYGYVYNIALHYRYPLGLYNADETFEDYRRKKFQHFMKLEFDPILYQFRYISYNITSNLAEYKAEKINFFEDVQSITEESFTLPTLIVPLNKVIDESRMNYLDILCETGMSLLDKGEQFEEAFKAINYQLTQFTLPTKKDGIAQKHGQRFGYLEQRAIQAELIFYLKNALRDAYLVDDKTKIKKYITALNIVYYVNLKVSGVSVEQTPIDLRDVDYIDASYMNTGILGASMYNAAANYAENVRMLGTRGHGIAAERANDLMDKMLGKDSMIVGDDNVKNGADRLVNGEAIQTKYCATAGKSISECFEKGKFRYVHNGKPMQIEVPKDQYEQALQSMRDRIQRGDLSELGITDPEQAEKIVRKGNISYKTAQRIAKAGTVEGISYDAAKGMVTGIQTFGISATVSFATAIWRGENAEDALESALKDGTMVFGRHVMQHVLTQQVGRTAIEKSLRPATDYIVNEVLGSKTSSQIVNTFFRKSSQRAIHGAAARKNLSKLMRGNLVTMTITTAVLSTGSIYDAINGRISGSQLVKNIGTTSASVGGATLGATLGSIVPVVGTFVGGFVGGFIGGKVSKTVLDEFITDDAVEIMELFKNVFIKNIEELQLDRDELNYISQKIFSHKDLTKELKLIYAASDSEVYISDKMEPYIDAILKARPKIKDVTNLIENYQDIQ